MAKIEYKIRIEGDNRKWSRTFPKMSDVDIYIKACREAYGSIKYEIENVEKA